MGRLPAFNRSFAKTGEFLGCNNGRPASGSGLCGSAVLSYPKIQDMAKCNFSIPFSGSAGEVYNRARAAVEKQGGSFTGDSSSGSFSINVFGTISGSYKVSGQQLEIEIEDKPMMIPCSAIENVLKSQIGS